MKRKRKKRRVHEAREGGSYKTRMLASIRTARGRSTSRQHQGQEAQPTLVNVMTQFQIMNQNIQGLRDDMKKLGGRVGQLGS